MWNISVTKFGELFALKDNDDGDLFVKENDIVRTFKQESGAVAWIRAQNKKSNGNWCLTKINGEKIYFGDAEEELLDENLYGPHVWEKVNLATLSDASGCYDIRKCSYCGKTKRVYGLEYSYRSGTCKKNPLKPNKTQ